MPTSSYEIDTYRSVVNFSEGSWGAINIQTKPDFHGFVYPFTFFFFDSVEGQNFFGIAEGADIFHYGVYIEVYGRQPLFSGMLAALSAPGQKHIQVDYANDLPINGNVAVNVNWAQVFNDPALAGLTTGASLRRLPERLRQRLSMGEQAAR
ncbi:MAG: hypothetical protein JOY71_14375 [Acetobacteraceae bacterium]|nr:hypothetical protein [Acetobacteraceae bacterium]